MKLYGLKILNTQQNYWMEFATNKKALQLTAKESFKKWCEVDPSINGHSVEEISNNQAVMNYIVKVANKWLMDDTGIIEEEEMK